MRELLPRLADLAEGQDRRLRVHYIDAEEADRLELSLDVIETLAGMPELTGWGRFRPRGAGLSETRAGSDRLARRPRGANNKTACRWCGWSRSAYWGQRDQARTGTRARDLSGLYPQGRHRPVVVSRLRPKAFAEPHGVSIRQFATHNAHAGGGAGTRRPARCRPAYRSGASACTGWARRCTRRSSGRRA